MGLGDTYGSLNPACREIRLLRLLPGSWEDSLSCDLQVVSLDDQPGYQALSYVWGTSDIVKTVWLHGKAFEATLNLWAALRRLRNPCHERIIWADATCINQKDLEERSHQVALMGEIYSSASEVFVWLGDSISEPNGSLKNSPGTLEDGKNIKWLSENIEKVSDYLTSANLEDEALAAFGTLHLLSVGQHWTVKPLFVADSRRKIPCRQRSRGGMASYAKAVATSMVVSLLGGAGTCACKEGHSGRGLCFSSLGVDL